MADRAHERLEAMRQRHRRIEDIAADQEMVELLRAELRMSEDAE